ncbi:MAG: hypothetical protein AMXMBFR7_32730 [Planctomycetota bacterium]
MDVSRFWVVVLLALCGVLQAGEFTLVKVDGEEVSGPLKAVDAEKGLTVGAQTVALTDLEEVTVQGARAESAGTLPEVVLRNGDRLAATVLAGNENELKVKSELLGELTLKSGVLRGIVFRPKVALAEGTVNAFFEGADPDQDKLLTARGESLSGFMGAFTDKDLTFEVGGQKSTHTFEELAGFRFAALEAFKGAEGVKASVRLADGSALSGRLAGLANGILQIEAAAGLTWAVPLGKVLRIGVSGGKLTYLGDLEPKSAEQLPLVGGSPVAFPLRKDRAANGTSLNIGKQEYEKGLGVHSFSKLTYDLGGGYALFLADVGLDASAPAGAVCTWKVLVDGTEKAQGEAKGTQPAQKVKVALAGGKTLELICDYGSDNDDAGDHLNWAKARLVK